MQPRAATVIPVPTQRDDVANDYLPVLFMLGFGVLFAGGALGASWLLGQRGRQNKVKNTPYECGMPIRSEAHSRFSVKFFIVAMLFILFDVEVVFMFPWVVSYGSGDVARASFPGTAVLLAEAAVFLAVLFLGWVYVVKKGVLEWHKES